MEMDEKRLKGLQRQIDELKHPETKKTYRTGLSKEGYEQFTKQIIDCELSPYWKFLDKKRWPEYKRKKLIEFELAAFKLIGYILAGKLLPKGIKARDFLHKEIAEKKDLERIKKSREKDDCSMA